MGSANFFKQLREVRKSFYGARRNRARLHKIYLRLGKLNVVVLLEPPAFGAFGARALGAKRKNPHLFLDKLRHMVTAPALTFQKRRRNMPHDTARTQSHALTVRNAQAIQILLRILESRGLIEHDDIQAFEFAVTEDVASNAALLQRMKEKYLVTGRNLFAHILRFSPGQVLRFFSLDMAG